MPDSNLPSVERLLLDSIRDLRQSVQQLTNTLQKEYPKRRELEERYVTKQGSWNRFWLAILFVIIAIISSFFVTISTVSVCFLDAPPHPGVCGAIPGFNAAQVQNAKLMKEFNNLLKQHNGQKRH